MLGSCLILRKEGLLLWTMIIVWNTVSIWDALSAFIIHTSNPRPEFIMIQRLGSSMFFAASAVHLTVLVLVSRQNVRMQLLA